MIARILILLLASLASAEAWSQTPELSKRAHGEIVLSVSGAVDTDVVELGAGRWLLIWISGNPPRIARAVVELQADRPIPSIPEATQLARKWLSLVPEKARARAPELAKSFESVAADIDAGKIKSVEEIIAQATERNRAALGDARNAWLPWFEALREYLNGLAAAGKLTSPADHSRIFRELAEGLRG